MNLPTLAVAALLALCLGLAVRSIWKGRGSGCSCCKCSGARPCRCGEDERR